MTQILIIGDSFSSDWSKKYNDYPGWPNLLAQDHNITNLSQPGCSEYRILQQLESVDLNDYDFVIVSHTSPSRIYTRQHPIHYGDLLHNNSDLIFTDIEYHASKLKNWLNRSLKAAKGFFVHHYDMEFYDYVYNKIRDDIHDRLYDKPTLIVNHLQCLEHYKRSNLIDFSSMLAIRSGLINHFSAEGNRIIYKKIKQYLDDHLQ